MNYIRKIIAFLMVFVFLFSNISFAAPIPSDVVGTKYEKAASFLSNLNIMVGDDRGRFDVDKNITKAEMAKIMVHMVGYQDAAGSSRGLTEFVDVPPDYWASGFINIALRLGIITTTSDYNFYPNASVTYIQAIAMIVNALGYEPAAKAKGGYPFGYLVVVNELDIIKDLEAPINKEIIRGDAAMLIYNALNVPLMVQIGYGSKPRFVKTSESNEICKKTCLLDKLSLKFFRGEISRIDTIKHTIQFNEVKECKYTQFYSEETVEYPVGISEFSYDSGVVFEPSTIGTPIDFYLNTDNTLVAFTNPENIETYMIIPQKHHFPITYAAVFNHACDR